MGNISKITHPAPSGSEYRAVPRIMLREAFIGVSKIAASGGAYKIWQMLAYSPGPGTSFTYSIPGYHPI
jgi:hypothetical protein